MENFIDFNISMKQAHKNNIITTAKRMKDMKVSWNIHRFIYWLSFLKMKIVYQRICILHNEEICYHTKDIYALDLELQNNRRSNTHHVSRTIHWLYCIPNIFLESSFLQLIPNTTRTYFPHSIIYNEVNTMYMFH